MVQRKPEEMWHCDSLGGCQGKAQVQEGGRLIVQLMWGNSCYYSKEDSVPAVKELL